MIRLEEGEKLILEARKHWFVAVAQVLGFFFLAVVPLIAFLFVRNFSLVERVMDSGGDKLEYLMAFLFFIWFFFLWIMLFINLAKYYLDVWYLTDRRLIDVEQKLLFNRDEAVLRLENIQDVAITHDGIVQTLLGFGSIRAQTAGERMEFVMKNITNPGKVKDAIGLECRKIKERVVSVRVEN